MKTNKTDVSTAGNRKKRIVTAMAGTLLLLLYAVIFLFSAQDAGSSGKVSMAVSRKSIDLWDILTGRGLTEFAKELLAISLEGLIRKSAHFLEYTLMGVLVYIILSCRLNGFWRRFFGTVVWVFISAALDELHQYFVPGRWAGVKDVLIDTCGGVTGALICACILGLFGRRRRRRDRLPDDGREKGTDA